MGESIRGDVYFLCDENEQYIKIGMSRRIKDRVAMIQTDSPFKLKLVCQINNGGFALEKMLHRKFLKYKMRGEWFTYSEEIKMAVSWIKKEKKSFIRGIDYFVNKDINEDITAKETIKFLDTCMGCSI